MKPDTTQKQISEVVTEFMLTEYQAIADSRVREIERGQSYVNSFLTITSGAAALLALMSQIASSSFYFITLWILFVLLLLGIVSFIRVIERDIRITKHGRGMSRIRRYFVEIEPRIEPYLSHSTYDDKPKYIHTGKGRIGLRSIVSLINNSVGATLVYLITFRFWGIEVGITIAVITFSLLLVLHELYANACWRKAETKGVVRFPSEGKQHENGVSK